MYQRMRLATIFACGALLAVSCGARSTASAFEITAAGERMARYFDALDVEHHWLPGERINWRSGEPSPKGGTSSTHCSAFVAAACAGLDVYILRPPEHKQTLLANAQNDWLADKGKETGWRRIASAAEAQQLANRGNLVVATYGNPDAKKPGHIALVRPSRKNTADLAAEGPDVIQAGAHNHNRVAIVKGFGNHRGAWANGEIAFYAHVADLPKN